MSIGTFSLRIIGIELVKKIVQWEARDCLKLQGMTLHIWKLQYNRNCQDTYESSYMKCYDFFYCVLFTIIDIDFYNLFINYDS